MKLQSVSLANYIANAKPSASDIIPNSTVHRPKKNYQPEISKEGGKKKKIRGRPRESGLLKSEEKKTSSVKRSSLGLGDGLGDLVSLSCLYFVQFRDPQSSKKRTELQAPYSETSRRRMQDQHTREPSFQQKHSVSVRVHRPGA